MQRINFTQDTLSTLKRSARCSFANAVYKLTMKAQQGLKCDDLFKKSVLMNEVNKLLCKYKLDECISFHPYLEGGVSTWSFGIGNFAPDMITYYLIIDGEAVLIGRGTTLAEINIDINNNTESTGVSSVIGENGYITITSPIGCFIKADLYGTKDPAGIIPATQVTFLANKCPQVETCVNYTEEELNCIAPQDLQLIFEFTHRYKETLAKSTKRVTSPSTSSSSSSASDCCNWGSIGGSIGNQSDLVAYLNTIEKNLISVYDETTEITGDLKSLKFLGAGVTATNSGGNVSVTIPGGGGGGPTMIELTNAELLTEITAATIVKGVIYRVTDAIGGIVQVVGRSSGSVNKAAYREGRVDISITQVIGIYGTYDPVANTFVEQGRIATEPTVNEDAQHGYYVGQELKTLDTGLTYVCTDNTNTSAVWTLVPGGGGSQDLAQVLAVDNISGPNDIEFDATQGLLFSNTSRLREGTIDAGLGGNKGIAQICAVGYELKWEAGRLYVMDGNGTTIRLSLYNFATAPTFTDDSTKGYAAGSRWVLDDGTVYTCLNAASGIWVQESNIPDLQQVTDAGFGTTNRLLSDDGAGNYTEIGNGEIQIATGNTGDVIIDASLVTASYVAQLPDKPTSPQTFAMLSDIGGGGGGGASISYYLNGSVSQGTFGGVAMREVNRTPIIGTGTDFTIATNGYIQSFITDANDPNQLVIPAGNWNFETYFSASSGGGSPSFYIELHKWDGATLTLIASNSATPEGITNGTAIDLYFTAIAVPQTTLALTDRLAIRIYVNNSGRTITLHTENGHLCQVITTFTTGLTALNGLTAQVQNFATVGTSGIAPNWNSVSPNHTLNIPLASASSVTAGLLSNADYTAFNGKQAALVSGTNIKTVEGNTLLGSSPIVVAREIQLACSDETTALTSGTAKVTFRAPRAMVITGVRASLTTAQTSGSIFTVDINDSGTSILSTKLTIDNTEKTSVTAATAPVISDSAIADDAEITIDIDQVGDGTAKGLKVTILYTI